ncbi:MAG: glycosyltransferase [Gemmatimonadetes bacterium]|nr:glycosyltransferase [Gemmatimonadota bacterium]
MKILFLTSRLPWPPDRGDRVRTYHFLRVMAEAHDVTLLSFADGSAPPGSREALRGLGARVVTVPRRRSVSAAQMARAFPSREPFQVAYYRSSEMKLRVRELAADSDVVVAHLLRMAPYLAEAPARTRRIVDLCDCISSEYVASLPHRSAAGRWFYGMEARRMAPQERAAVDLWDEAWVISEAEVAKLGLTTRPENLHIVPNGVTVPDGNEMRGTPASAAGKSAAGKSVSGGPAGGTTPARIIFTGHFGVPHNIDAAQVLVNEVLPLVRRDVAATVELAGASPIPAVRELGGAHVEVTGWVDDLFARLARADVFVAPLRFVAGVQNKILEAMAAGCPVVTTDAVRRGLGAEAGRELLVGETPTEIAAHAVALLKDPDRARALGDAGRDFVRTRFAWETVLDRLEAPRPR